MNSHLTEQLQATARRLLSNGEVDLVLGFERGTLPMRSRPVFVRKPEDAARLVCDGFSANNLARYLTELRGQRVAIVARGCESRSIATLVAERVLERDKIVILGVPCQGIVDPRRIANALSEEIVDAEEEGDEIVVRTRTGEQRLHREDYLSRACEICTQPNPDPVDVLLGEPVAPRPASRDWVAEREALSAEERWARFAAETEPCIRCYACREACPLCYCTECFVDRNQPRWLDSGNSPAALQFWHIIRAYHQTGRCVTCGACERACPMGIPLIHLTDKLNRVVHDLFGPDATLELDAEARGAVSADSGAGPRKEESA